MFSWLARILITPGVLGAAAIVVIGMMMLSDILLDYISRLYMALAPFVAIT